MWAARAGGEEHPRALLAVGARGGEDDLRRVDGAVEARGIFLVDDEGLDAVLAPEGLDLGFRAPGDGPRRLRVVRQQQRVRAAFHLREELEHPAAHDARGADDEEVVAHEGLDGLLGQPARHGARDAQAVVAFRVLRPLHGVDLDAGGELRDLVRRQFDALAHHGLVLRRELLAAIDGGGQKGSHHTAFRDCCNTSSRLDGAVPRALQKCDV